MYPGEWDRMNVRALVGKTWLCAVIRQIITILRPFKPKRAGRNGSKTKDAGVSTLKQVCSGRYSGTSKLSSRRFERAQD